MSAAPRATPPRCTFADRPPEGTRDQDRCHSCRIRRSVPSARSTRRWCRAAPGGTTAARRRRRGFETAGLPASLRDRAAGTARRDTPPPPDTRRRGPDARAAARSRAAAATRAAGPACSATPPRVAPRPHRRRRSTRCPPVPLPASLECDPEGKERGTVRLQVGPGEERSGEIDAERAAFDPEPHTRATQSVLHEGVPGAHPHHLLVPDVDAESRLR